MSKSIHLFVVSLDSDFIEDRFSLIIFSSFKFRIKFENPALRHTRWKIVSIPYYRSSKYLSLDFTFFHYSNFTLNSKLSLSEMKQNENAILDREIRFQIRINYKMARLNSVERLEIDGQLAMATVRFARIQIIRFTRWPCIFIVIKPCQVVAPISLCNYPAPPIILFYLFFSFFFFSKTDNSISIRINRGINDESLIQSTLVRKSKRNR